MNLLILGKKGIAIQEDLEKDLDNSWNIFNWEPSESPDKLVKLLENADVAVTGSDALIYGNIFKYISSSKKLKLLQIPFAGIDWLNPDLLPKNLSIQVFRALLENFASEQGARMSAMDNATRNASEMIDKLKITYNRSRQATITSELIEIISGAEAL